MTLKSSLTGILINLSSLASKVDSPEPALHRRVTVAARPIGPKSREFRDHILDRLNPLPFPPHSYFRCLDEEGAQPLRRSAEVAQEIWHSSNRPASKFFGVQ